MLTAVLLAAFWFAVFAGLHLAVFHLWPIRNRSAAILKLFLSAVAGLVLSLAIMASRGALVSSSEVVWAYVSGLLLMACCFVLWTPAYYVVATSLSVATVVALDRFPEGVPAAAVMPDHLLDDMIRKRLDSMVLSGTLQTDGDAFRLTPKGRRAARFFSGMNDFWKMGPGG